MKTQEAERLHPALTDNGISLKSLDVDSYMKTIKLIKKLSVFLTERTTDIQTLIKEYNKDFTDTVKSEKFKKLLEKKKDDLTTEESELLAIQPSVKILPNNLLSGPSDFIDKVNAINSKELKFKKDELNYIGDAKVFKAVVENTATSSQEILYDFLYKQ